MGLFNFFKKKQTAKTETTFGFVSEDGKKGISMDKAQYLQEVFLSTMQQDDMSAQFNAAAKLMMNQSYQGCIEAYSALAERYPDRKGDCQSQIGAAYFFLGDYDQAIENYLAARENGMDADMMDDNIWEACETLYKKTQDKTPISKYMEYCPNGSYAKKANKILS